MKRPILQPMDVVVVDGLWYMPHHWLIRWRGLDPAVHCLTLADHTGNGWSPEFTGIVRRHVDHYAGRRITIHRLRDDSLIFFMLQQAFEIERTSKGYDFRQWLMGGVLGITREKWVNNSSCWDCAEFPYWTMQDRLRITPKDEVLPMPRLFRYNPAFETIFNGVW